MNNDVLPKCLACGVCCFSRLETYVRVSGADWTRLGDDAGRYAYFIGHRAYMNMEEGHCAALEIQIGSEGTREYICRVYDRRPQICRDLERGSPQCAGERLLKSDRPSESPSPMEVAT
ncbi:MAG: YkgJ family cysteine cluster protein [Nibricoccus sp.]